MDLRTRLLLAFTKVLGWIVRATARRRLRTASPEKSQRIEKMFAEATAMQRDSEALQKRLRDIGPGRGNTAETMEALLEFNRKYSSPEMAQSTERHLNSLRSMEAESKCLEALKESAGTDLEKQVALMREYHETHPNSRLGRSSLIGSLRKAGHIDEAISLCRVEDMPLGQYNYHQSLGHLLLAKKDWDGALEQAKLAQNCQKTDPMLKGKLMAISPQLLIAAALAGQGKTAEANKLFDKCLRATSDKKIKEAIQKSRAEAGL